MMIKAILKKYWKILLSMTLVSALGVGILTGLTGSFVSLVKNMDRYIEEYQYPDAVITTEVVPKKRAEDLLKTEGVEYVDARLAADTVIENAEGRMLSIRAFSYTPEDRQVMHVWSGTVPDGSDDSLLAEVLAVQTRFGIGMRQTSALNSTICSIRRWVAVLRTTSGWRLQQLLMCSMSLLTSAQAFSTTSRQRAQLSLRPI